MAVSEEIVIPPLPIVAMVVLVVAVVPDMLVVAVVAILVEMVLEPMGMVLGALGEPPTMMAATQTSNQAYKQEMGL